jgi:hypothetical protein
MRRLASQERDDAYSSRRDYQELTPAQGALFRGRRGTNELVFPLTDATSGESLLAIGGYARASRPIDVVIAAEARGGGSERAFGFGPRWSRFGLGVLAGGPAEASITWEGDADLSLWGVAGGAVVLPPSLAGRGVPVADLLRDHLVPETFYFPSAAALELEADPDRSSQLSLGDGVAITLKKCSYCGRLLPIDPDHPGGLAFHKHSAKLTGHQNECRACKKWRINDSLNPLRTTDQLHESSVITRERKMFLREPEILQALKDRTGAGLKSQIWERFGRRCFYCERELELDEVQLDHTRPLAYLWPIDAHATCLCADHNNQKSDKFPVDFYSDAQLRKLAAITGLSLSELRARELNDAELARILADPAAFASEWGARHFAATARRVSELRPDVDLFALLELADRAVHAAVMDEIQARADPVASIPE